jgi:peptidyl-Asp metalloendopeptidase
LMEAVAPAAVATTVDVALGYTNGFASELGGDSQAVTRLQHLVDIANQAYANSQINAQIRLVRTVSVNYPDATDNNDALAKLSGYQSGSGSIPVDPAFNALRTARDQYGADLVSLVRRFRTPENKGCGVAWLIGGNQSRIDNSDAPWGYSVVSDDIDRGDLDETDSKTYVCRKETLAHEMGHNMGQAHNSEDSDGTSGAHSYSYGYREVSVTGFYTVMAYRLASSSQRPIRYFANPNVLDLATGRPTGVANAADNARSMAITMPIVSTFRAQMVASSVPARNDIDANGRSEILWNSDTSGQFVYWSMNGPVLQSYVSKSLGIGYRVAATGDFNGDARSDLLWEDIGRTGVWMWLAQPNGDFAVSYVTDYPSGNNRIAGAADIDGNGRSEILWHSDTLGQFVYWRMNGPVFEGYVAKSLAVGYRVAATGDFNGDGRFDILWENLGRTGVWMWLAQPNGDFSVSYVTDYPSGNNRIAGAADITGDGRSEILWHSDTLGQFVYWSMNGPVLQSYAAKSLGIGYRVSATGDFNGDGRADVLWESNDRTGVWMWLAQSNGDFAVHFVSDYPAGNSIVP